MKKISGSTQILIAMIAGIVAGFFLEEKGVVFAPLGDIFILLIKMVIIPLVFFSIISGAAALGETKSAGKVGVFTIVYYLANIRRLRYPGASGRQHLQAGPGSEDPAIPDDGSLQHMRKTPVIAGFWETIQGVIPDNPFDSLVIGEHPSDPLFRHVFRHRPVGHVQGKTAPRAWKSWIR